MRHRPRARAAWPALALAAAGALGFSAPQSASVSPSAGPSLEGDVTGTSGAGGSLTIRIDATVPGGWDRLHLVEAAVVVGGEETDRFTYDIEDARGMLGETPVIAGTGGSATGRYLALTGSRIVLTTGGANLTFRVVADVVSAIPSDARFDLSVTGDRGEHAEIRRRLERPPTDEGPTWASVLTAALVALLAGGFVGNVFASRRRPPRRPSVYDTINRRLDTERAGGAR